MGQAVGIPHIPPSRGWKKADEIPFFQKFSRDCQKACCMDDDYPNSSVLVENKFPIPLFVRTVQFLWRCLPVRQAC